MRLTQQTKAMCPLGNDYNFINFNDLNFSQFLIISLELEFKEEKVNSFSKVNNILFLFTLQYRYARFGQEGSGGGEGREGQ